MRAAFFGRGLILYPSYMGFRFGEVCNSGFRDRISCRVMAAPMASNENAAMGREGRAQRLKIRVSRVYI